MNERPILFNGQMIKAILFGTKTQTRRVVKAQASKDCGVYHRPDGDWVYTQCGGVAVGLPFSCPYGQPGDRLWVRETWQEDPAGKWGFCYKAGGKSCPLCGAHLWRPSIHMPRRASRITLEITYVRVERLQDITQEDAASEGVKFVNTGDFITPFAELWERINGKGSWEGNPWVWVVKFKKIL